MKKTTLVWACFACLAFAVPVQANQCSIEQQERVERLSAVAAQHIVSNHFLGGRNVLGSSENCASDAGGDEFQIDLRVFWDGFIMPWNHYEILAEVRVNRVGDEISFVTVWGNDTARSLEFWGKVAGTTLDGLEKLR